MVATASTGGTARARFRTWRIMRIGPLNERAFRIRLLIAPAMLSVQLFLYDRLWTAVYSHITSSAGMSMQQTVTYALLALLLARIQWSARTYSRDRMSVRVRDGTIVYWFLRPISPGRYYMWQQTGEMAYGAAWAIICLGVLLGTGVIQPPASAAPGTVFLGSLLLGQIIFYYLGQIVELGTFWFIGNDGLRRIYFFVQDLLSGAFIPIWFMPSWLVPTARWLPFSYGINVPVSIYINRIPMSEAAGYIGLQATWAALLGIITWRLWSSAARRVTAQGG